ncbi:hypothetical protein [Herpetosiphon geysericola]|uniref:Uncharacterized protein n=1 Tax=Herpetosiphon geysericola TaxID=70996 RepID=A0A0P6YF24_9CHLR|nr:hypothetical protein [Herpetosiphon geysericola]KPL90777.1 hypothetical protein SE18_05265 [Herpetosiphon geysericola]
MQPRISTRTKKKAPIAPAMPPGVLLADVLQLAQTFKDEEGMEDNAAYDAALQFLTDWSEPQAANIPDAQPLELGQNMVGVTLRRGSSMVVISVAELASVINQLASMLEQRR